MRRYSLYIIGFYLFILYTQEFSPRSLPTICEQRRMLIFKMTHHSPSKVQVLMINHYFLCVYYLLSELKSEPKHVIIVYIKLLFQ